MLSLFFLIALGMEASFQSNEPALTKGLQNLSWPLQKARIIEIQKGLNDDSLSKEKRLKNDVLFTLQQIKRILNTREKIFEDIEKRQNKLTEILSRKRESRLRALKDIATLKMMFSNVNDKWLQEAYDPFLEFKQIQKFYAMRKAREAVNKKDKVQLLEIRNLPMKILDMSDKNHLLEILKVVPINHKILKENIKNTPRDDLRGASTDMIWEVSILDYKIKNFIVKFTKKNPWQELFGTERLMEMQKNPYFFMKHPYMPRIGYLAAVYKVKKEFDKTYRSFQQGEQDDKNTLYMEILYGARGTECFELIPHLSQSDFYMIGLQMGTLFKETSLNRKENDISKVQGFMHGDLKYENLYIAGLKSNQPIITMIDNDSLLKVYQDDIVPDTGGFLFLERGVQQFARFLLLDLRSWEIVHSFIEGFLKPFGEKKKIDNMRFIYKDFMKTARMFCMRDQQKMPHNIGDKFYKHLQKHNIQGITLQMIQEQLLGQQK